MKIVCVPPEFRKIFNRFRDLFSRRQFFYFYVYVYSLIILEPEYKNVTGISKSWAEPVCRSSLSKFLSEVRWDFTKVLRRSRRQVIRMLSERKKGKRHAQIILDDTTLAKFGLHIFGVNWYRKYKNAYPFLGLQVVVVGILSDGWLIPLDFHIYVREKDCEEIRLRFETKLEQAAKMLRGLKLPKGYRVEVMFDSWYLNKKVTGPIESKGWKWLSRCAPNRSVLWEGEEKRINFEKYVPGITWEKLNYRSTKKHPAVVGHHRIGHLRNTGRVKIVISSLQPDGKDRLAFFCTNDTRLPMVTVIGKFEQRWKIEVFFKEARKCFAFGRWQYRDIVSVVHHLCLTLVAAMLCACIRMEERASGGEKTGESWGQFTRRLRDQSRRHFLRYFLEKYDGEYNNNFEELCAGLGV